MARARPRSTATASALAACGTIAPNVGILGTPGIHLTATNPAAGKIYVVAESQLVSGTPPITTYYHRLWALDITTLSLSTAFESAPIAPTGSCSYPGSFSQFHIQRPALLLSVDQINPATKFSVPTVANGYVYLGTQGALC